MKETDVLKHSREMKKKTHKSRSLMRRHEKLFVCLLQCERNWDLICDSRVFEKENEQMFDLTSCFLRSHETKNCLKLS